MGRDRTLRHPWSRPALPGFVLGALCTWAGGCGGDPSDASVSAGGSETTAAAATSEGSASSGATTGATGTSATGTNATASGSGSTGGSDTVGSTTAATATTAGSATDTGASATDSDTAATGTSGTDTAGPADCGAIVTFETGLTPTSELHVRTTGVDAADCGASDRACATVEFAARRATAGTAVVIHAGTYAGDNFAEGLSGTAQAPIWIGGAPGEPKPVIEGGANGLQLSRVRYVVVHDLEIRNASGNGLNIDDGADYANPDATRFIVIRGLDVHDIGTGNNDCIKLSGLDDFWVLDSRMARCGGGGSGSAVDHVGCHAGLLAGNVITDNAAAGNAFQCKGGSADLELRGNLVVQGGVRGVNMGGSTGDEFFRPPLSTSAANVEASDIRVIANVFVGSDAPLAFVGCVDCLAAHNTLVAPERWVLRILQERASDGTYTFTPASGGRFENNLVVFDASGLSTVVNVGADTDPDSFVFANNLWFARDDPSQSDPGAALPVPETGTVAGRDPLLVDPSGDADGDYRPSPGSPAIAAGRAVPQAPADFAGDCYADPPTIGAFEVAP